MQFTEHPLVYILLKHILCVILKAPFNIIIIIYYSISQYYIDVQVLHTKCRHIACIQNNI